MPLNKLIRGRWDARDIVVSLIGSFTITLGVCLLWARVVSDSESLAEMLGFSAFFAVWMTAFLWYSNRRTTAKIARGQADRAS